MSACQICNALRFRQRVRRPRVLPSLMCCVMCAVQDKFSRIRLKGFFRQSSLFLRHNKLRLKQDHDIVVYEDLSGEVRFSKHLPPPNNLNR